MAMERVGVNTDFGALSGVTKTLKEPVVNVFLERKLNVLISIRVSTLSCCLFGQNSEEILQTAKWEMGKPITKLSTSLLCLLIRKVGMQDSEIKRK